jgi:hypothetical protein
MMGGDWCIAALSLGTHNEFLVTQRDGVDSALLRGKPMDQVEADAKGVGVPRCKTPLAGFLATTNCLTLT